MKISDGVASVKNLRVLILATVFIESFGISDLPRKQGTACIDYGFHSLGLDRIVAHAMIENKASSRVMQKLGMRYVGEGINEGHLSVGYGMAKEMILFEHQLKNKEPQATETHDGQNECAPEEITAFIMIKGRYEC